MTRPVHIQRRALLSRKHLRTFHQVEIPWNFLFLLIPLWVISLTPFSEVVRSALAPLPSLVVGTVIGFVLLVKGRTLPWVLTMILVVFTEQIFVLSSSFVDEMVLLFMVFNLLGRKTKLRKERMIVPLIFFSISCVISALVNDVPAQVLVVAIRSYVQYALFFVALCHLPFNENDERQILLVILYSAVFFSILAVVNISIGATSLSGRAEGALSNPNALAGFLVFVLPFFWLHYIDAKGFSWFKHAPFQWAGIFVLVALAASGSRSMIIGVFCGLLLVTSLKAGDYAQKLKFILLLTLVTIAGIYMTEGRVIQRFKQLSDETYMDVNSNVRTYYTEEGLKLFQENPVIGVGPGRYGGSVATIFPSPVYHEYNIRSPRAWSGIAQADIFYPHLLAELGLLGSLFFFYIILKPVLRWTRLVFTRRIRWTSKGAFLSAALVSIIVASLGGPYFELKLTALFFWLYLFLVIKETDHLLSRKSLAK